MPIVAKEQRWHGELWPADLVYNISPSTGFYSCKLPEPMHTLAGKKKVEALSLTACQVEVRDLFEKYKQSYKNELP